MIRLEDIPLEETRAPEPPAPPLSALWTGRGAAWRRHHLTDRAAGLAQTALYHALRPAPPEAAAALGRRLGAFVGRREDPRPYVAHMRRAVALIRPDLGPAAREALLAEWWRTAGETEALWPALDRLAAPGRLTIHGEARLDEADADPRPTIYVLVHLGSWELIGNVVATRLKRPAFGIYEPEPNRFRNRLVFRARAARGLRVFPPSRQLPRRLLGLIRGGCNPTLFVDEVSEGRCKFPLWGREVPERSNLTFTLGLAHRTGARLQPCHFLRDAPGRASLHLLDPLAPAPPGSDRDAYVAETARALSAAFEPRVAANLAQWYMLKAMRVPERGRAPRGA